MREAYTTMSHLIPSRSIDVAVIFIFHTFSTSSPSVMAYS